MDHNTHRQDVPKITQMSVPYCTLQTPSNQTTTNFDFSVSLTLPLSLSPPSQPLQLTMKALNSRHAALSGSKP